MKDFFAHSVEGKPPSEWHRLEEHLKARLNLLGLLHLNSDAGSGGIWRGCGMMLNQVNYLKEGNKE